MKNFEASSMSVIFMLMPRNKALNLLLLWPIHQYFKRHFPLATPEKNEEPAAKVFGLEKMGFQRIVKPLPRAQGGCRHQQVNTAPAHLLQLQISEN